MNFPRVLIVGQIFDDHTGGGITLKNLFRNWPRQNIAIISGNLNEDWSVCGLQYLIGNDETAKPWPFSLLQEHSASTIIRKQKKSILGSDNSYINAYTKNKKLTPKQILLNPIKIVLDFIGIRLFFNKTKLSPKLSQFVEDFQPEIIYSQLSSLDLICLVDEIHEKHQIPIAIHIMDDWPAIVHKTGLLGYYWNKRTNNAFRKLINKSSVHLSISDAMSIEYKRRYGKDWVAFHNPIEIQFFQAILSKEKDINSDFIIMYRGRIGSGIIKSLIYLIKNIEYLRNFGFNVKIQLGIEKEVFGEMRLDQFKCAELMPQLPYKEVLLSLAFADLIVIVYDFDRKSKEYMKYSMPTKATEYMASGVPVLVFAPPEIAVTKYARAEDWGYVVYKEDKNLLQKGIVELFNNQELRDRLITNAKRCVIKNHDAETVREKFREALSGPKNAIRN